MCLTVDGEAQQDKNQWSKTLNFLLCHPLLQEHLSSRHLGKLSFLSGFVLMKSENEIRKIMIWTKTSLWDPRTRNDFYCLFYFYNFCTPSESENTFVYLTLRSIKLYLKKPAIVYKFLNLKFWMNFSLESSNYLEDKLPMERNQQWEPCFFCFPRVDDDGNNHDHPDGVYVFYHNHKYNLLLSNI